MRVDIVVSGHDGLRAPASGQNLLAKRHESLKTTDNLFVYGHLLGKDSVARRRITMERRWIRCDLRLRLSMR